MATIPETDEFLRKLDLTERRSQFSSNSRSQIIGTDLFDSVKQMIDILVNEASIIISLMEYLIL